MFVIQAVCGIQWHYFHHEEREKHEGKKRVYITTAKMLEVYQQCLDMSDDEYMKWSERAREIWASIDERALEGHL